MKIYDARKQNANVVKEFTEDLEKYLNDAKSLDGMKIPELDFWRSGREYNSPTWGIIEEGKIYLSVNETGYPYLVTRVKIIPKMSWSANKGLPQDRIAWASLRMHDKEGEGFKIFAKNPKDKTSVLDNSNGMWNDSNDFWLYADPIYIGDLYAMPFGFMNWRGNPLP
jgi:hypothetical protein